LGNPNRDSSSPTPPPASPTKKVSAKTSHSSRGTPPTESSRLPPAQGKHPPAQDNKFPPAQGRPPPAPNSRPPPAQHSRPSPAQHSRPPPTQHSRPPPTQNSRSYTSMSSSQTAMSHGSPSLTRTSSYQRKSSTKKGGGWGLFKKKETPVTYKPPPILRPVTKHAITKASDWDKETYCWALYNFHGELPCDLQFNKGQRISIITRTDTQDDWWEGTVNGKTGIFPANYVSL